MDPDSNVRVFCRVNKLSFLFFNIAGYINNIPMKNLIKILIVVYCFFDAGSAFAKSPMPNTESRLNFGIYINPEFINTSLFDIGLKSATGYEKNVYAFSVGSTLRYRLSNRLYLNTGLGLGFRKTKDVKTSSSGIPIFFDTNAQRNYFFNGKSSEVFWLELLVPLNMNTTL